MTSELRGMVLSCTNECNGMRPVQTVNEAVDSGHPARTLYRTAEGVWLD